MLKQKFFNYKSPLHDKKFVTSKIAQGVALNLRGGSNSLIFENLEVSHDWGRAPDSVGGIISIAKHTDPTYFIVATGKSHTLRDFVSESFESMTILDGENNLKIEKSSIWPTGVVSVVGSLQRCTRCLAGQHKSRSEKKRKDYLP